MLSPEEIQALIRFVADERRSGSDLAVEYQVGGLWLRVGGDRAVGAGSKPQAPASPATAAAAAPEAASSELPADAADSPPPSPVAQGHVLTSPIVGTFYVAPSPDAPPYVEVGGRVEKGQVVCIVEAMKLMNEIEADVSGVVVSVEPSNGDPVEFGTSLFVIRT